MEKHRLNFAQVNLLNESIAEVIFDKGIDISIEMMEEIETIFCAFFKTDFGVIVNKIYPYTYSLEAQLSMGSLVHMKSIASINYSKEGVANTQDIINKRNNDKLNVKQFNGLELGRQQALKWLQKELA
ncbi:hypothetical protein [Colwellia hornerae]|uniref:Uncharacterized protein n=1 Tax=Colwellia hornerae TaxID=89402 RepID=A0A5C6QUR5_9GAMM|nr:hypothetical protein [Colwellia hornerae]TWX56957.1 hypothetical protein ESZ28_04175 [Colwellia hornerae]TWX62318.1 hypothetical protein ESZ26_02715 [Colwellia hornerae]TWX72350.1 hypothetical protein ESZ27_00650 [Colwellia hornerae]